MLGYLRLGILAITGTVIVLVVSFAGWSEYRHSEQEAADAPPLLHPPGTVAAVGIVEPASDFVEIASPMPGLVMSIHFVEGQFVQHGDTLLELDGFRAEQEFLARQAQVDLAKSKLELLQNLPRREETEILVASIAEAAAAKRDLERRLSRLESVLQRGAASDEEVESTESLLESASARHESLLAELRLLEAGAWSEDLKVAESELAVAEARLEQSRVELDRHTIKAPRSGTILKANVQVGEAIDQLSPSIATMGDLSKLHVRAQVDEYFLDRLQPPLSAVGFPRGRDRTQVELHFLRVIPLIQPKENVGSHPGPLDTRTIDVIFEVREPVAGLVPGQVLDVFLSSRSPVESP